MPGFSCFLDYQSHATAFKMFPAFVFLLLQINSAYFVYHILVD